MKFRIIICILIIFSREIYSQEYPLRFDRLGIEEGLSNSWVRHIFQDSTGYIWAATGDGISKYDGYNFEIFRNKKGDTTSIGNNSVRYLAYKSRNEIWVCTDDGVFIYNELSNTFSPFEKLKGLIVRRVLVTAECVWFGTDDGLVKYIPESKQTSFYTHDPDDPTTLSNDEIYELFIDSEENFWIGTRYGLNLYNSDSESFIRYVPGEAKENISGDWVSAIAEDKLGRIWVGSPGGTDLFTNAKSRPKNESFKNVNQEYTLSLRVTSNNQLWIGGGAGTGLKVLDLEGFDPSQTPDIKIYKQRPFDDHSPSDDSFVYIFEDKLGDLWLGGYAGGLNYFSPRKKPFDVLQKTYDPEKSISHNLVNAVYEDKKNLWIGTEYGLDQYAKKNGSWDHFIHDQNDPASLGASAIYKIYKDSKSNLWIGVWNGGLNKFNPKNNTFKTYIPAPNSSTIGNQHVFAIEEAFGNLWVGTIGGGLNQYDHNTEEFIQYLNNPGRFNYCQ